MVPPDLLSLKIRCAVWPAVYSELLRTLENKCVDVTRKDQKKQEAVWWSSIWERLGRKTLLTPLSLEAQVHSQNTMAKGIP